MPTTRQLRPLAILTILLAPSFLHAQGQALDALAAFADHICRDAPLDSRSSKTELSAQGKAEVNGFLKYLTNLGVDVNASRTNTGTSGILQDQLAGSIANSNDCRKSVVHDFRELVFSPSGPTPSNPSPRPASPPAQQYIPEDPRPIRAAQCCFRDRGNWCTPWRHEPDRYAPEFRQSQLNAECYCGSGGMVGSVQENCR
jgi:hypothetical protein